MLLWLIMNHVVLDIKETKNKFRHSVSILVGGTVLGHLITALALPIATRLYNPADFNVLAVFISIISIVSVAASLRFDVAIPVAASEEDAPNLLLLAVGFAFFLSVSTLLVLFIFSGHFFKNHQSSILFLLPIAIFLVAVSSGLQGWFIRKSDFKLIARSRFYQSICGVVGQLGLGFLGVAPLGLLVGYVLNFFAGFIILGSKLFRKESQLFSGITLISLKQTFKAYSRYPKYSTFEALCNSASIQVPIIIIASLAIGPEAGYLTLAMSVMQAPMLLIGNAVGQVYLSKAPDHYLKGNLDKYTLETLGQLSKIGIGPLIFVAILAPEGFAIIFGEEWRRAGEIVTWMSPCFILQFLASPLSMVIHVVSRQKAGMCLQLYGLFVRVIPILITSLWDNTFIIEVYALSGLVFYLSYLIVIFNVIKSPFSFVMLRICHSWQVTFVWLVAGFITLHIMHPIWSFLYV